MSAARRAQANTRLAWPDGCMKEGGGACDSSRTEGAVYLERILVLSALSDSGSSHTPAHGPRGYPFYWSPGRRIRPAPWRECVGHCRWRCQEKDHNVQSAIPIVCCIPCVEFWLYGTRGSRAVENHLSYMHTLTGVTYSVSNAPLAVSNRLRFQ